MPISFFELPVTSIEAGKNPKLKSAVNPNWLASGIKNFDV